MTSFVRRLQNGRAKNRVYASCILVFLLLSLFTLNMNFLRFSSLKTKKKFDPIYAFNQTQRMKDGDPSREGSFESGESQKISLILPCTLPDVLLTLEQALISVYEGSTLPEETILVLNVPKGLPEGIEELFSGVDPDIPTIGALRSKLVSFFHHYLPGIKKSKWFEMGLDANTEPEDGPFLSAFPEAFIEMVQSERERTVLHSLIEMNAESIPTTSLAQIAAVIPNFRIVLADAETGAAYTREVGAKAALEGRETDDRVVVFQDCDDFSSVHRIGLIRRAFELNPEADMVLSQFQRLWLDKAKKDDDLGGSADLWSYDTKLDEMVQKYLPWSFDPYLKWGMYHKQEDPDFLKINDNLLDPHLIDPKSKKNANFSWFLSPRRQITDGVPNQLDMMHNGNVAWRANFLRDLMPFPRSPRGQDARLLYKAFLHGGKALGIDGRLMSYTHPGGQIKRRAWQSLLATIADADERINA